MKSKIIKISLLILMIALTIFGIYNLAKNEVSISNIFANPVKQLANENNYFPDNFTISQLNRFFVPYYGDYQIYCDNRGTGFPAQKADWYRGGQFDISKLSKNITYKKIDSNNSWEDITPIQKIKAAYIFSSNNANGNYNSYPDGFDSLSSDEKFKQYNKVSENLVNWYIKQQAYWLMKDQDWGTWAGTIKDNKTELNYNESTQKFELINPDGSSEVVSEIKNLGKESKAYYEYVNKGTQTVKFNSTSLTAKKSNGVYTVGPLNLTHTGYTTTLNNSSSISFSGISGIYVDYYNKNGDKVDSELIKKYNVAGTDKTAKYFTPNGNEKIDRNSEIQYPRSGEGFSIQFDDPNKGKTVNDNNWVTNFKIRVQFKYMKAEYDMQYYIGQDSDGNNTQPVYIVNPRREIIPLEVTIEGDIKEFDLSLRKFITEVNGKAPSISREPTISQSELNALKNGTKTTATKVHPKDALEVSTGDKVVYTIRVYNEGVIPGKATEITDHLPAGLKLAENSSINTTYGWTNPSKDGKTMVSTYLKNTEIKAFDGTKLDYKDIKIECEVIATNTRQNLKNIAEITADSDDDRDSTPKNVITTNYGTTSQEDDDDFEVLKLKPILKLSGNVWEDLRGGKETVPDGLKDGNETGIDDIIVTLYKKSKKSGEFIQQSTTYTQKGGNYAFDKLDIADEYYIKFTYNGQLYENTLYKANNSDTGSSQAKEDPNDRDQLNEGLEEINGDEGYTLYDVTVQYDENGNVKDGKYTTDNNLFKISAKTDSYTVTDKSKNTEISNISFGITKRIEFDMKLEKDVYAATVTVNGKTQIYGYNEKGIQDSLDLSNKSEQEREDALNNWTINVNVADYERPIAKPDYNFTGVNGNSQTLEVYVTYKIAVKNQSMSMLGEVTRILDYYDESYTYVPNLSWRSTTNYKTAKTELTEIRNRIIDSLDNNKPIKKGNESEVSLNSNNNNTLDIKFDGKQQSGENQYIYLTFKIKKNTEGKIKTGIKTNIAEIASFKSYYKKGTELPHYANINKYKINDDTTIAGRVDRDSIPNNLGKGNNPHEDEDDEDKAPGLNVKVDGTRTITGIVWEDARTNTVKDSVIGDGTYEEKTDSTIDIAKEGIKIALVELKDGKYTVVNDKPTISGNKYTFQNVVAGDYIVRFTYGDGTTKYNGQDYKTTIYQDYGNEKYNLDITDNVSRAGDIWSRREELNQASANNVRNELAEKLAKGEGSSMTAETAVIVAEIEFNRQVTTENSEPGYTIGGTNLGLVERPKAQLELDKSVSNIKVTLADGRILFDVNKAGDNVIWKDHKEYSIDKNKTNGIYKKDYRPVISTESKGLIQLTMDEEIMHGATIEITYKVKVKNVGEVDYAGQEFYYLGKNPGNIVTTIPNRIIDYVSNNLQFNSNNNTEWQAISVNDVINNKLVNQDIANIILKDNVPQFNRVVTTTFNDQLKPGESTAEKTLVLTQTITPENTNDNLKYINIAEIVETSNTAGRRMAYSTVGNQDPTIQNASEVDSSVAESVVILPPFGDTHIYYILGAAIGIILIGGIAFIIRKVLKK